MISSSSSGFNPFISHSFPKGSLINLNYSIRILGKRTYCGIEKIAEKVHKKKHREQKAYQKDYIDCPGRSAHRSGKLPYLCFLFLKTPTRFLIIFQFLHSFLVLKLTFLYVYSYPRFDKAIAISACCFLPHFLFRITYLPSGLLRFVFGVFGVFVFSLNFFCCFCFRCLY